MSKEFADIVVIGGVGTARNVCEQILDARDRYNYPVKRVKIIIDTYQKGEKISGIEVAGGTKDIPMLVQNKNNRFLFCLHRQDVLEERHVLASSFQIPGECYTSFVHPRAYVASSVRMGYSNIILSSASIQSDVVLGNFNVINSNVTIEHETKLGDGNFVAANSCIGSKVKMGNYCFIGLNSAVRENVTLGNNVFAGMCSLIISDFSNCRIKGQPAKPYSTIQ